MQAAAFRVTGRVQGVWMRKYTREAALKNGAKGYVENMPDGSVAGWAMCDAEGLSHFEAFLHEGSPGARVETVEMEPMTDT
ncbi:hypothetical protein KIPB_002740, partial [Kipferlia bialata]|eukprot:g2740.t1